MPRESTVLHHAPMPKGYGFLKKGNPYLTANVRRKTHAADKKLYVVAKKSTNIGLRAPRWILKEVVAEERATREKRQHEVQRRDGAAEQEFEAAIRRLFPRIPDEDLQKVVRRALKKRSGRVGRTKLLSVDQRARLAVSAHIRHCHTQYDTLVRGPMSREKARDTIKGELAKTLALWGGSQATKATIQPRRERKMMARKPKPPKQSHLPDPSHKQRAHRRHVDQRPLPQNSGRKVPTRTSLRLGKLGGDEELEILSDFPDDEDDQDSSDDSVEGNEGDPDGLYEESSDELDESEEDGEDDFATEWDSN